MAAGTPFPVLVESGSKRVFASALEWPGWARSAKSEGEALAALAAYVERYKAVPAAAAIRFAATSPTFEVVERAAGGGAVDFGVPGAVAGLDGKAVRAADGRRLVRLLEAAWEVFDSVVAGAPASLRKGPRGGGRDRDKIVDHVLGGEVGYARKIGVKVRQPPGGDHAAIAAFRHEVTAVLAGPSDGGPLTAKGWPLRYAVRRFAWHALDHAWEIEDRSE